MLGDLYVNTSTSLRHFRCYVKFQELHFFQTAPNGEILRVIHIDIAEHSANIPGSQMEHMKVVLHHPLAPAGANLLTSEVSAYKQVDIWAHICSSFVWNRGHIFS